MRRRRKLSKRYSRRVFRRTASRVKSANLRRRISRGGYHF